MSKSASVTTPNKFTPVSAIQQLAESAQAAVEDLEHFAKFHTISCGVVTRRIQPALDQERRMREALKDCILRLEASQPPTGCRTEAAIRQARTALALAGDVGDTKGEGE